jgi:hypothetical protein
MRKHRIGNKSDGYKDIPYTAEEEAARDAEEADIAVAKPMQDWDAEMQASDTIMVAGLARTLEEFFDTNPAILAKKPQSFKDNHAARKKIRARRPQM